MNRLQKLYKRNVLALANHHKEHCDGAGCIVSLWMLKDMAEKCGVTFTKKEMGGFI